MMLERAYTSPPIRRTKLPRRAGLWRQGWHRLRRNPLGMLGLSLVGLVILVAVFCPLLAPDNPDSQAAMFGVGANAAPAWQHLLGTGRMGYDVFSRLVYGAPTALAVGIGAMAVASVIGVLLGGISGYAGGLTDELLMRFTEFFLVVPIFLVILAVVRLFGVVIVGTALENVPHLTLVAIIILIGLFGWPPIARLARAEFLRLSQLDFVEAARCIGTSPRDIVLRHILPNALPSLVVVIALGIGGAILTEAMISFLGFGDPNTISWGEMLYFNYQTLKVAPWATLAPGAAIFITVLGFNLLADGMSDAFNPRLKQ
ncbi:MAG: ABC transporter permease [Stellaceae bacterium]